MLIPLTREEATERAREFDLFADTSEWGDFTAYKCRHWDENTTLCTAYDERPRMCAQYPYGKACQHDKTCSCTCGKED